MLKLIQRNAKYLHLEITNQRRKEETLLVILAKGSSLKFNIQKEYS